MRLRAVAILKIDKILEALEEDDRRAVAYEVYRTYGGPLTDAERSKQYRDRHRNVTEDRDASVTNGRDGGGHLDIDVYVAPASSSKKKPEALNTERLEHAKALLEPADFEFLTACPEPFRTQWLVDAEWWVSLRDGYPKIPAQQQASRYMAWAGCKRKKDHRAALRNWFSTADRWRERDEQRQAVRR